MFQTTPPGPRFTPNLYSDPQVTVMNEITKSTVSDSSPPKQTVYISPQEARIPVSRPLVSSIIFPPTSSTSLPPTSSYIFPPSYSNIFPSPSSIIFPPPSSNISHPSSSIPPPSSLPPPSSFLPSSFHPVSSVAPPPSLRFPPSPSASNFVFPPPSSQQPSFSPQPGPSSLILGANVLPPRSMIFGGKMGVEEVEWMRKGLEQKIMESRIWRKMGRKLQKYVMKFMKIYPAEKSEAGKFETKVKTLAEETEKKLIAVTKQQSENLKFFEDKIELNERYNLMVKENEGRHKEIQQLRSNISKLENSLLESEHVINKLEFEKADYFKQSILTTEIQKRLTAYEQKLIFFGNELDKSYQTIKQKTETIQQLTSVKEEHETEENKLKDQLTKKEKLIIEYEAKIALLSSELMRIKNKSCENLPFEESKLQEDSNILVLQTLQYDQLKNELSIANFKFKHNFVTLLEKVQEKSIGELNEIFEKLKRLNEEFTEEIDAMIKKIKELNQLNLGEEKHPISKEVMELRMVKMDLENKIKELSEKLQ